MGRASPRVGDFDLTEPLGRGGMGEVWRGRHRPSGTPVAVKLLKALIAEDRYYLGRFQAEVRAVAALHHPHIVRIYDHGTLREDQPSLGGGISAGSPWLAMELLDGQPLSRGAPVADWQDTALLLHQLLDALAHAHARGLVHRDLKPANVVFCGEAPASGRVVLLDFGLAQALDESLDPDELGTIIGTAAYMAPEQFRGRDTDFGPWTDLYALGCLAWALLTGRPPFGVRRGAHALGRAHLEEPPPELEPLFEVPEGTTDWLGRLLHKDPRQRFRRAADAAWALRQLQLRAGTTAGELGGTTFRWGEVSDEETVLTEPGEGEPAEAGTGRPPFVFRPPLPPDWRGASGVSTVPPAGTGLGLFGLRELPLVGREAERDALWAALQDLDQGRGGVILLQGPAGCGKSRLARWLGTRAHELGLAEVFEVRHALEGGRSHGLGPALARHLRVAGLPRDLAEASLRRRLGAEVAEPEARDALLADLLEVALPQPRRGLRRLLQRRSGFSSPAERYGIVAGRLWRAARSRPLVLRVEDAQWGADTLAFCRHLLDRRPAGLAPILVLLTARELDPEAPEARLLAGLLAEAGGRRVPVQPLEPGFRPAFLRELVQLEPALAEAVEARSGGIPLYMVQLLEGWIHQGALVAGPGGFELRPGAHRALPDDVHALWGERLERALRGRDRLEARALELAAVLGLEVDAAEWRAACREGGAWATVDLVDALLRAGLAESHPDGPQAGFRFVHALLRDSLLRQAREGGRLRAWREAAVAMLRHRRLEDPGVALRLGRLLVALGERDAAVEPLSAGAWEAVRRSEYLLADQALREREEVLRQLGADAGDRRLCEGWIMQARVARRRDQRAAAVLHTRQAVASARACGWADLLCQGLREQARLDQSRGRLRSALAALKEATDLAQQGHDGLTLAWCLRDFGLVSVELGAAPVAVLERAARGFSERREPFGQATALLGLARTRLRLGEVDAAARALDGAEAAFSTSLSVQEPAHSLVGLADVARLRGDAALARERYRRALARFRAIGAPGTPAARRHLAAVHLDLGEVAAARALLQALLREALDEEARGQLGLIYLHLAWAAALDGDTDQAARHLELGREEVRRAGEVRSELLEVAQVLREAVAGESALLARLEDTREAWQAALMDGS